MLYVKGKGIQGNQTLQKNETPVTFMSFILDNSENGQKLKS